MRNVDVDLILSEELRLPDSSPVPFPTPKDSRAARSRIHPLLRSAELFFLGHERRSISPPSRGGGQSSIEAAVDRLIPYDWNTASAARSLPRKVSRPVDLDLKGLNRRDPRTDDGLLDLVAQPDIQFSCRVPDTLVLQLSSDPKFPVAGLDDAEIKIPLASDSRWIASALFEPRCHDPARPEIRRPAGHRAFPGSA